MKKTKPEHRTEQKQAAMLQALEKTMGVILTASKISGIGRTQHYEWMRTDPKYKEAVEQLKEVTLDFVETSLYRQIKEGNTQATLFYLRTKGRERGYTERQELEVTTKKPLSWLNETSN